MKITERAHILGVQQDLPGPGHGGQTGLGFGTKIRHEEDINPIKVRFVRQSRHKAVTRHRRKLLVSVRSENQNALCPSLVQQPDTLLGRPAGAGHGSNQLRKVQGNGKHHGKAP